MYFLNLNSSQLKKYVILLKKIFSKFKTDDRSVIDTLKEIDKYELDTKYEMKRSLSPDYG